MAGKAKYFECETGTGRRKFWEISRLGPYISLRWGVVGSRGTCRTKAFFHVWQAEKYEQNKVIEKLRKGYMQVYKQAPMPPNIKTKPKEKKPLYDPEIDDLIF